MNDLPKELKIKILKQFRKLIRGLEKEQKREFNKCKKKLGITYDPHDYVFDYLYNDCLTVERTLEFLEQYEKETEE